jgi:hypothetical protein
MRVRDVAKKRSLHIEDFVRKWKSYPDQSGQLHKTSRPQFAAPHAKPRAGMYLLSKAGHFAYCVIYPMPATTPHGGDHVRLLN